MLEVDARDASIRTATPTDEPAIRRLLGQSDLPHEDVRHHLDTFVVAEIGGTLVGVAGFEPCGKVGLLRSLAVSGERRGRRLGTRLYDRVLADARRIGIERLYLLTTTAEDFFSRLGFVPVERSRVPASVRETLEFRSLCPENAVCMERGTTD